jgi:hypothetical protein
LTCLLVLIGVRADGRKEAIALTDGYRAASESWATTHAPQHNEETR